MVDCNEMVARAPHIAFGYDSRGRVHLLAGRLDAALADFDTALRMFPRLAAALYGRGLVKRRRGDAQGARADMEAARAIKADVADELALYGLR